MFQDKKLIAALATAAMVFGGAGIGTARTVRGDMAAAGTMPPVVRISASTATTATGKAGFQEAVRLLAQVASEPVRFGTVPQASGESPCECPNVLDEAGLKNLPVMPGKQVVLLIHGISEGPKSWSDKSDSTNHLTPDSTSGIPTLKEALKNDQNYTVGTFNYDGDLNDGRKIKADLQFVDKNRNLYGPMLAQAIKCLADKSGMKVSLVGYSRGGLVAQEALFGDSEASDDVAGLVSIDTPWMQPYAGIPEVHSIPPKVPVMPVGSEITLNISSLKPDSNASQVDLNGLNLASSQLHDDRVICSPVQKILVVNDWYRTTAGDGCFQAKDQLSPPTKSIVTDSTVQPVKCGPVDFAQLAQCSGYLHEQMQSNREIVEPIVNQLNRWRTSNWLNDLKLVDNDGRVKGSCVAPAETRPHEIVSPPQSPRTTHCDQDQYLGDDGKCHNKQENCRDGQYRGLDGDCPDVQKCRPDQYSDHGQCKEWVEGCPAGQYMDHGECKTRPTVCDHSQVSDGHGSCKDRPQDCRPGQVRHADGECYDTPGGSAGGGSCRPGLNVADGECGPAGSSSSGTGKSGGDSGCPNGMIRVSPATNTSSGCMVPPGGQREQCSATQHRNDKGVCESDTMNQAGPCPKGLQRDKEGVCRSGGSAPGGGSSTSPKSSPPAPGGKTSTPSTPKPKSSTPSTGTPTPTPVPTPSASKKQSSRSVQPVLPNRTSAPGSSTPPSSGGASGKICKASGKPPPPGGTCPKPSGG